MSFITSLMQPVFFWAAVIGRHRRLSIIRKPKKKYINKNKFVAYA